MLTRVALITSDHRRHRWVARLLARAGVLAGIISERKPETTAVAASPAVSRYFEARTEREAAWFSSAPGTHDEVGVPVLTVPWGGSNSEEARRFIATINPDRIALFGSSMIREPLLSSAPRGIINLHLGLSPYYRGSATNFWPLVDGRPECVGATVHHATPKLDGGAILGQARPVPAPSDDSHDLGCKSVMAGADLLVRVASVQGAFPEGVPQREGGRLCRRADFGPSDIETMQRNFSRGMLADYLRDKERRDGAYPIVMLATN